MDWFTKSVKMYRLSDGRIAVYIRARGTSQKREPVNRENFHTMFILNRNSDIPDKSNRLRGVTLTGTTGDSRNSLLG